MRRLLLLLPLLASCSAPVASPEQLSQARNAVEARWRALGGEGEIVLTTHWIAMRRDTLCGHVRADVPARMVTFLHGLNGPIDGGDGQQTLIDPYNQPRAQPRDREVFTAAWERICLEPTPWQPTEVTP